MRNITTIVQRLVVLIFLLCFSAQQAHASSIPAGCTNIVYSANPHYPPFHWAVGQSGFEGASIELLSKVLPNGVKLQPVVYPWKRVLLLAEQGEIDLVLSLRVSPEREKYLAFTKHRAFPNPTVVFVRKDKTFNYKAWQDLKGHKGAISLGDTFGGGFDEYWRKELDITESGSLVENFNLLDQGVIDYFVTGKYSGLAYLAARRTALKIISLEVPVAKGNIHFGFSRRSPCAPLVDYVNKQLEELDKAGVTDKLYKKHLNEPLKK